MKYYCFILFFFQFAFSQKGERKALIKQDFKIESTRVLNSENSFVFIDSVFVENKLMKESYELNDSTDFNVLLGKYSQSDKLNHKYYIVDFYLFKKGFGLKKTHSLLLSDLKQFANWNTNNFKEINGAIDIKVNFSCQTEEIILRNVIYTNDLLSNKIVFEVEKSNLFFSIFNSDCQIFERLKYNLDDFSYYYTEGFIVLKSKKFLILYTSG